VQQTSEISVETLITRDELVGKCQARHEATLLEPEYGRESTTEEDTLNSSEGDKTLGKSGFFILNPADGPVSLLANARNYLGQLLFGRLEDGTYWSR
jgi:hypothetical protein